MRKLNLLALAASAACIPTIASAQAGGGAGHSWREGAPMAHAPPPVVRHAPRHEVRQMHRAPGQHHGRRFGHIQRINRGGFVPQMWWGPQFVVRNWGGYGFAQPFQGGRWIRYYDDALLIDRTGRVHDSRYGHDWDRHGDRWSYDQSGIPVYVGDGDFEPDGGDYEWAERWEQGRDGYARHGGAPSHHGYGQWAHGCGCGPVVVTETVTTTAPVMEQVTTYEYVTEYAPRVARAAPAKRKLVRRAPARPRPGERG
ncbi:MAG TPA: RcnB family protein [Allosphingosinicella sp.]|nr:RcnB family protein [Allosphingosinicella sp.]